MNDKETLEKIEKKIKELRKEAKRRRKMTNLIKDIWQFKQNKPTLIVRDIQQLYPQIPENFLYSILLSRGVFKWLSVRRELIKLKDTWKEKVKNILSEIVIHKKKDKLYYSYLKGYLKGYEECRKEVRQLCHLDRLQAPDFDKKANEYLRNLKEAEDVT